MASKKKTDLPQDKNSARERAIRALELRRAGLNYDQIAEQLGYSQAAGVYNVVKRELERARIETADDVLNLELSRLDRMEAALWPAAARGEVAAIDRLLKIAERRAKYLGLDAPTKQQVEVTAYQGGTDIDREVERLAEQLKQNKPRAATK